MPGCPEVENSYQDPFRSLSVFQYSVLIINGCGLEMGVVLLEKRTPLFRALDPPLKCACQLYCSFLSLYSTIYDNTYAANLNEDELRVAPIYIGVNCVNKFC